jgi:putative pyruvate formate lyase activating enzyme
MTHIPDDFTMCSEPVRTLWRSQAACRLCPRRCGVNRLAGQVGYCRTGPLPVISSYGPHLGEESVLSGISGSGTVFFTGCNLRCVFCQNFEISHLNRGNPVSVSGLVDIFLELQDKDCHNINLVSPSHQIAAIAVACDLARKQGLTLPIVYNSGGYDSVETLHRLDGLMDIYMPDMKYADAETALHYSDADDYPAVNQAAVREMQRQVGSLHVEDGIAKKGLLVRHLVLPRGLAGTAKILNFLKSCVSLRTAVNIMDQYHPAGDIDLLDDSLRNTPTKFEIDYFRTYARENGLRLID